MIHRVLVYHTSFNWSLVSVCQHVLCVVFVVCYISPSCGLTGSLSAL